MKEIGLICSLLILMAYPALADPADFNIGEIELSDAAWGHQTARFKLNYTGDNYTFIVAASLVQFFGGDLTPSRYEKKAFLLGPETTVDIDLPVNIPGNFGDCEVEIYLYDVIDTLDEVFESQKFFTRSLPLAFPVPESLKKEVGFNIALPKFVEKNEVFDNHFSRILIMLLDEGKNPGEIARLCKTDEEFVKAAIAVLQHDGYLKSEMHRPVPDFAVINRDKIKKIRPYIESAVEALYSRISENFAGFDSCIQAMITDGRLTKDKQDALHGGTVLYHVYPFTMTLFLWDLLGREFVNDGKPFNIFEGSEPCNAVMSDFMYIIEGSENRGETFYYFTNEKNLDRIYCGIGEYKIDCIPPNYRERARRKLKVNWRFSRDLPETIFLLSLIHI